MERLRKVFFWAHLSVGVAAGSVIFFMAGTGILMSFEPQIVAWAEKDVRWVTPAPGAVRLSADEILARAQTANPAARASGLTLQSNSAASAVVACGRESALYVDPYTGNLLGTDGKAHGFMRAVEDLHRWLGARDVGKPVTGASALAFFFLLLSGMFLWWPRAWSWKKLKSITLFNPRLSGKARDFNWHNVIGFWAAPLILVTTVTGIVMSYSWATNLLYRATGNKPPVQAGNGGRGGAPILPDNLERFFTAAAEKSPGWVSIGLRFPMKAGGPVNASIQEPPSVSRHPNPRSQLTLDAATAETIKWEPFAGQNSGRKLRAWTKPVHTGQALGWPGQLLAVLSATSAALLVWTGFAMAWRRFRNRKAVPVRTAGTAPSNRAAGKTFAEASARRN